MHCALSCYQIYCLLSRNTVSHQIILFYANSFRIYISAENLGLHVLSFLSNSILKEVAILLSKLLLAFSQYSLHQFFHFYANSFCICISAEDSSLHVFSFLSNSILKEISVAIQKGKPGAFSPGRPMQFRKNYKSTLDFLAYLEGYCPSRSSAAKFRGETVYMDFMKQWNTGVYFSLRFQEIAGALDSALKTTTLVPSEASSSKQESKALVLKQTSFKIIHDLNFLAEDVCGNYLENVLEHLKSCPNGVLDLVKQSILQGSYALKALQPLVINSIVETLVLKSAEELRQMKGITATYRVTNRPLPVRHSPYVSGVLRNLKVFLEGERTAAYLSGELQNELLQSAAYEITRLYHGLAAELVSNTRKTENSLQRIRMGAQRRVGASSDVSDTGVWA